MSKLGVAAYSPAYFNLGYDRVKVESPKISKNHGSLLKSSSSPRLLSPLKQSKLQKSSSFVEIASYKKGAKIPHLTRIYVEKPETDTKFGSKSKRRSDSKS